MNLRAYGNPISNFVDVLASYEPSEFDSPLRSTIPLLEYWRNSDATFLDWAARLELEEQEANWFEFEFAVPPTRGTGKPSFTDLAIATDKSLLTIEAKYLEPPYETCAKWLGPEPTQNRVEVLAGWLELLSDKAGRTIDSSLVSSLPYQLIHRTASACTVPKLQPIVIYQVFESSKHPYYFKVLEDLAQIVGNNIVVGLQVSHFEPSYEYQKLIERFQAGERKLSTLVTDSLKNGSIGKFVNKDFKRFA